MDLDVGQVRAFLAVVEHRHFGRAAQSLFLTQQALSKRIARLERVTGRLLERGAGEPALTRRGERFLPYARRLLHTADEALQALVPGQADPLRVDVWGDAHPPARLVRKLAQQQPELVLELSGRRNLPQALRAVRRGDIDLAFGNLASLGAPLARELSARLVTCSRLAVLVSASSDLARRNEVRPEDLRASRVWWPVQGSSPELVSYAQEWSQAVGVRLSTDGNNLGVEALIGRIGLEPGLLTLVDEAWPIPGRPGLAVVPLTPAPLYPWYAVWRTDAAHPLLPTLVEQATAKGGVVARLAQAHWLPCDLTR